MLTPGAGFVVLTGDNGSGKTNILEAISLLAPGRGLRRAALSDMARQSGSGGSGPGGFGPGGFGLGGFGPGGFGPGGFGIAATLALPAGGDIAIATGTQAAAPDRRIVRIQGATAGATALAEWLSLCWLTPAMDRLFTGAASDRRRFLDRLTLALVPSHAVHANRYDAAMRARTRLLAGPGPDHDWLIALEAQMAEHGGALHAARAETVAALGEALVDAPPSAFARAGLALGGWTGPAAPLAADLAGGRRRDAAAGRALSGPHRTDLDVVHLDKQQPAARCSTGEQKALLLGIVLAHARLVTRRVGRAPILLLDEVAAHLDPPRRAALVEQLAGKGQVWMTGTEAGLFADLPNAATHFTLPSTPEPPR